MKDSFSERYTEEGRNQQKKRKAIILFGSLGVGLLVGIVAIIVASYYFINRSFSGYDVVNDRARTDSNNVSYLSFQNKLLKYSRDGISLIDESGETLWNGGYEMEQPTVDICGDYVCVADVGAKTFYVYNGKDQGKDMEMTLPIGRVKVAANGKVAVLLHDDDSDVINVYDPYNTVETLEVEIPTNVVDNGYPLDFDISPDGKSLVIAYMLVENGTMENHVCFYNFTEVGQDQNTLVGGKNYETSMISTIDFVEEDEVVIFHETGFSLFANMKKPEEIFDQTFDQPVKSADHDGEHVLVVTGTAGDTENQTLNLFNLRGKKELSMNIDYKYSRIQMTDQEMIFSDDESCRILRKNGKEKFRFDFEKKYDYFFPANRDDQYYLLDEASIQIIEISG